MPTRAAPSRRAEPSPGEHSDSEQDEPRQRQAASAPLRWDRDDDLTDDGWPQAAGADSSRWRYSEFALIYGAYMTMLMARKNYGFWLPFVLSDLGAGKGEAGMLGSTFEIVYGSCALLNGVLIDMVAPKTLLICALLTSGGVNLAIGSTSSLWLMCVFVFPTFAAHCSNPRPATASAPQLSCGGALRTHAQDGRIRQRTLLAACVQVCSHLLPIHRVLLWGSNGFAQSFGWPSITNVFLAWFPDPASRGSWYSLLSTCQVR